jgi:hypothetical protein
MTETIEEGTDEGRQSVRRDGHLGELNLRRLLAGESLGETPAAAAITAHLARCPECTRRLDALAADQRAFEERISFDRFSAGVERAARVPGPAVGPAPGWARRPASTRSFLTVFGAGAIAAGLALFVGARPIFQHARERDAREAETEATNRTKGGATPAAVTFRIAPPPPDEGPQRTAAIEVPEPLAVGERIRVGVQSGGHRYLFAIAIDDKGTVTQLYPEIGTSMPLPRGDRLHYLPDALELTGRGIERVVVLLTDQRFEIDTIRRSATVAFQKAGGNLARLPNLVLPGQQFHSTFLKP